MKKQRCYIEFKRNGKKQEAMCDLSKIGLSLYGTYGLMKCNKNTNFKVEIR